MVKCNLSTYMGRDLLTIQDVCDKIGVSRNTIAFLRNGKAKSISFETLDKLCELFHCTPGDLLKYVEE